MEKITFDMKIYPNWKDAPTIVSYQGYQVAPGLIVHKTAVGTENGVKEGSTWDVSHMESGMNIGVTNQRTRKAATHYAQQAALLIDWTLPALTILKEINFDAMLAIRRKAMNL